MHPHRGIRAKKNNNIENQTITHTKVGKFTHLQTSNSLNINTKTVREMKYYIIAGEASGDLHGSNLMKGILAEDPQAEIRFWGGDLMDAVWQSSSVCTLQDSATSLIAG